MISRDEFWAKLRRDETGAIVEWHSLLHHSIDVAAVLLTLLEISIVNKRLAQLAGITWIDRRLRLRLGALALLHDIGKANRGFRARVDPKSAPCGHIDQVAWLFGGHNDVLMERLNQAVKLERFEEWLDPEKTDIDLIATIFAHHGRPWNLEGAADAGALWLPGNDGDPFDGLKPLHDALNEHFGGAFLPGGIIPETPGFHHAFAGLLMLADWIGSDTDFFPFWNGKQGDRYSYARRQARVALDRIGLLTGRRRRLIRQHCPNFAALFDGHPPHPFQSLTAEPDARLLVAEAATGSGKTEAALWRFRILFERGEVDGLYFALPTRVAASQIFERVRHFAAALFGSDAPTVIRAIPGQVAADEYLGHPLPDFRFAWDDEPDESERQTRWAAEHPKRFLAAQIVVGTIDQILLSVLSVRHAHLRGSALLRHLIVVDEVHSSSRYEGRLLQELLRAHGSAGGHALLLSATLGACLRSRLLGVEVPSPETAEALDYPLLSWNEDGKLRTRRLPDVPERPDRNIEIELLPIIQDATAIAQRALSAAEAEARVLVIRNTVAGAVAVQEALEALAGQDCPVLFRVGSIPTLHHGRFAAEDRILLDAAAVRELGPRRIGGGGRVVIGTQTLEISLDLDADLLITDLCPADVMLQRIGRLHRHGAKLARPAAYAQARVLVLVPATRLISPKGRLGHGLGGHVYPDLRIIEATWRELERRPVLAIPSMNRALVERTTHDAVLAQLQTELAAQDPAWAQLGMDLDGQTYATVRAADLGLLNRAAPFKDFTLRDGLTTRLGGKDLLLAFDPPLPGPFERSIRTLKLPAYLLASTKDDGLPTIERLEADQLGASRFGIWGRWYVYGRLGLMQISFP